MLGRRLRLDHLVLGVPAPLASSVAAFERLTGVKPVLGGRHEKLGTHNALVALDEDGHTYLELIARDPSQDDKSLPRGAWMGIDSLSGARKPKMLTWAVDRGSHDDGGGGGGGGGRIQEAVAEARRAGYDPGDPETFSRGDLSWTLAYRHYSLESMGPGSGIVPFLIDWGDSKSPARSAPRGCELLELRAVARDTGAVAAGLRSLGIDGAKDLGLKAGSADSLVAVLQTPKGVVEV